MYFWDEHRGITRYYEILMSSVCEKYQLRQMEYDILMFLYNNPQHNTAADIVRYRKSTKSHVSTSLKVLEEKGLIERRIDKDNKKRVEKLEKSGLYGELMPIDFENRHKYVKEHGYQLYGVYAFGDEHLPERIKDRNLILQELYKVKSESPDRVIRQPKKHRN